MPTPDIWITVLPLAYAAIWGGETLLDPNQMLAIGPTDQQLVGGLGGILKANAKQESGVPMGTLAYAFGWKAYNFQPKLMTFVTGRGDVVVGLGAQDEFVFRDLSLLPDHAAPVFFSWSAAPGLYFPASRATGNYGHPFQFMMTDEIGAYFGRSLRVSIAFDHYSDGGFTDVNPNSNAFTFNVGYRF